MDQSTVAERAERTVEAGKSFKNYLGDERPDPGTGWRHVQKGELFCTPYAGHPYPVRPTTRASDVVWPPRKILCKYVHLSLLRTGQMIPGKTNRMNLITITTQWAQKQRTAQEQGEDYTQRQIRADFKKIKCFSIRKVRVLSFLFCFLFLQLFSITFLSM